MPRVKSRLVEDGCSLQRLLLDAIACHYATNLTDILQLIVPLLDSFLQQRDG